MDEASKTIGKYPDLLRQYLKGEILDIGAGRDPISRNAIAFDKPQGDAQEIQKYFPKNRFDTVFSSHCLEHMVDPISAISNWYSLVKPGGHLVVIVPDEDLYEQGHYPSIFNQDHKTTFTLSKSKSWSPVSINLLDLCINLGGKIEYLAQQSDDYDFSLQTHKKLGMLRFRVTRKLLQIRVIRNLSAQLNLIPIDQTSARKSTLAQICCVIQKV